MLSRHGAAAAALAVLVAGSTVAMWLRAPAHPPWRAAVDGLLVLSVCGTLPLLRRRPWPAACTRFRPPARTTCSARSTGR
ncbi:hypothetical protein [Actinomadura keratinilytica]|uniref:hypothetical protein n=1 Tax=Actinomadura keratinilytica TaxID=547461 RepID=UPI00361B3542